MKPFGYIYLITNLINGKVYIGKSESTIDERWYTHKWRANHLNKVENPLVIDLAIAKYGENSFEIEEIDEAFSKQDILRAEAYWIMFYDATNPDKGYNIESMGEIIYSDNYESIWEMKNESESKIQKKAKWRESLIKKRIPLEKEEEFKQDLIKFSGLQLEEKYGLQNNRRALLREIRRILQDKSIKTISQAKKAIGGQSYNPKKMISPEKEEEFIEDFKLLSGVKLENKYNMSRRILVRNIKEIFKKHSSQSLESATSLEVVKRLLGGKLYSDSTKRIPLEKEQEFKDDIIGGLKERKLLQKYGLGISAFYRELKRLLGAKFLTEIRKTEFYSPPIKKYISNEREQEFIDDLKKLSGNQLEKKYGITHRSRLLREIRRVLENENLNSMEAVKKFVGGKVYSSEELKKGVPLDKEQEFKEDIRNGITRRVLCKKYKFGTKALYREIERLFNVRSLEEVRKKKDK